MEETKIDGIPLGDYGRPTSQSFYPSNQSMEFECKGDWDLLEKILKEAPKESEYITYKDKKWIKEDYCIPISVIQNKIDELEKRKGSFVVEEINKEIIKVLQELLEERE